MSGNKLEAMAREAAEKFLRDYDVHNECIGAGEIDCSARAEIAAAIVDVARRFARDALREVICEWNVINCADQRDCDLRIANAIKAAEVDE